MEPYDFDDPDRPFRPDGGPRHVLDAPGFTEWVAARAPVEVWPQVNTASTATGPS